MANQGPTIQELQQLINQLQAQVTALQAAPAAPAAAAAAQVVFTDSSPDDWSRQHYQLFEEVG